MTLEKRYITHGREFKWITKCRPDYCSSSCPLSGAPETTTAASAFESCYFASQGWYASYAVVVIVAEWLFCTAVRCITGFRTVATPLLT